jgi:hypothetical protein
MFQRMALGFIGGALIVLSVFIRGNSVAFNAAPASGASWVILGAGVVAALFSLFAVRTLMALGAGGAAAIMAAQVVDAARAGKLEVTMQLVVLIVGIAATIAATIGPRIKRVAIAADAVSVTTIEEKPMTHAFPTRPGASGEASGPVADEPAAGKPGAETPAADERTTSGDSIPVGAGA